MTGWRVWGELRRRPHLELAWAYLPGVDGLIEDLGGGRRRITLDARLPRAERRATLAHELVHDERGILFDARAPVALVAKEEALVEAEAVRRLVPLDELRAMAAAAADGEPLTASEVAAAFDVPPDTARLAAELLARCGGAPPHHVAR